MPHSVLVTEADAAVEFEVVGLPGGGDQEGIQWGSHHDGGGDEFSVVVGTQLEVTPADPVDIVIPDGAPPHKEARGQVRTCVRSINIIYTLEKPNTGYLLSHRSY